MELVRTYKKEVRLAYAVRQIPYVGTLHLKKGKDSEGVEVGLILLRKSKTQEVGLNATMLFGSANFLLNLGMEWSGSI